MFFSIISGHWARLSRPCDKFFKVGVPKIHSARTVVFFEEKRVFENLYFIIFVHLIQLFSSVENFGGGILRTAIFVLTTRETSYFRKPVSFVIFGH